MLEILKEIEKIALDKLNSGRAKKDPCFIFLCNVCRHNLGGKEVGLFKDYLIENYPDWEVGKEEGQVHTPRDRFEKYRAGAVFNLDTDRMKWLKGQIEIEIKKLSK